MPPPTPNGPTPISREARFDISINGFKVHHLPPMSLSANYGTKQGVPSQFLSIKLEPRRDLLRSLQVIILQPGTLAQTATTVCVVATALTEIVLVLQARRAAWSPIRLGHTNAIK
ncbi:hypothetical protein TWF106_009700 [Orbilia oligospora]|uniref:Uncharacterized protein n=1 Tax=Orbilia oligospora TaxID=2813651 RepID=A0A6G1M6J2_ORBOL|nr:hypothetical protein TWF679_011250 [Orbilia oligospora]KAF3212844.1 hypothetical protein TWF106_009700 [Orbilia oligospora]KAF3227293.1 hypothetical protein TWF191_004158 [Orbilia oligospora]KAF3245529.1 hypothetical protein TWF192_007394 [Orbilia oligospora]